MPATTPDQGEQRGLYFRVKKARCRLRRQAAQASSQAPEDEVGQPSRNLLGDAWDTRHTLSEERYTAEFYIQRRNHEVKLGRFVKGNRPGLTVEEFCREQLQRKMDCRGSDREFDKMLRKLAEDLPLDNLIPPSTDLVRRVLGVHPVMDCEQHVCPECGFLYHHLTRPAWRNLSNDKCFYCHAPRFEVLKLRSGSIVEPRQRFWL